MTDQTPTNTLTDTERERLDHIVHVRPFQTDTLRNIALFAAVESILAAREAHTNTPVVHVTAAPVAEDVVWCDDCEEWVTAGAPERTDAARLSPAPTCSDPECPIYERHRRQGSTYPPHGQHDFRAALSPAPTSVTSVEPGCTCGGIAACQQCQERDAAPAPTDNQHNNGCGVCFTCNPPQPSLATGFPMTRMYVCATCGNKRCPAAGDCRKWECSGSNDPDQTPRPRAVVDGPTTPTHTPAGSEEETNP